MEILGGIDCASRVGRYNGQALYYLIFTEDSIVAAKILNNKDELQKMKEQMDPKSSGVVIWSSNAMLKAAQIKVYDEVESRGRKIMKNLEEYIDSDPEGLELIEYSKISGVELSKGSMFGVPHLRLIIANTEIRFNLMRNIFERAGKLDDDVYRIYHKVLKKAFGNRLRIRV